MRKAGPKPRFFGAVALSFALSSSAIAVTAATADTGIPLGSISPQPQIGLQPGSILILRVDNDYRLSPVVSGADAERVLRAGEIRAKLISVSTGIALVLESQLARTVAYRAVILSTHDGHDVMRATSTCPLLKGKAAYEGWDASWAIKAVFIGSFTPISETDPITCREWPERVNGQQLPASPSGT